MLLRRVTYRLDVERLEGRDAPAVNPFDSPEFGTMMTALLEQNQVPLASLALQRGDEIYNWYSNPSTLSADSLFRVGSVSKTFCAAAVMSLKQQGLLSLDDSALRTLGYEPGQIITGLDPLDGTTTVGAALPKELFDVTIRQLLQMSSGLPQHVQVASASFPTAKPQPVIYLEGSYAALAFAHAPPFTDPADVNQQLDYYFYQVAREFAANPVVYGGKNAQTKQDHGHAVLLKPGRFYDYSDTGYAILGAVVQRISQEEFSQLYPAYLQEIILEPMGIAPPTQDPPVPAMVGLGRTLQDQAYPTEVTYETYPDEEDAANIFPDKDKTHQGDAPFYPTHPNGDAIKVPQPYGGRFYLESHFGEGGLVATPTGLVTFFNNLSDVLEGEGTGPLTRQSVKKMIAPTPEPLLNHPAGGWFGFGWQVQPATQSYNDGIAWVKNGSLPGNSALLYRYHDGTVWAATFSIDVLDDPDAITGFQKQFQALVDGAVYGPRTVQVVKGSPQSTPAGAKFADAVVVLVLDVFGGVVQGAQVTFTAPTSGPSGRFNGQATAIATTHDSGQATAPGLKANAETGHYQVHAKAVLLFPPSPIPFSYSFSSEVVAVFELTNT